MRTFKKILAALVCVCMLVPCVTFVAYAANGRISFSDPSTAVGEMVDVKCVIKSTSGSLGDTSVTFSYDSSALRFNSGDGVSSSGGGTLTYSGNGGSAEVSFTMTFQALSEGETKLTVSGQDIKSSSGSKLTLDQGNSTIKIAAGDPSKITQDTGDAGAATGEGTTVDINGQSYQLNGEFADIDIPAGFTRTTMAYEGAERPMVVQEVSGVYLAYLTGSDGVSEFYVFDDDNATFFPFEQIDISDTSSIILLNDDSLTLPSNYVLTTLTLNGHDFPVWGDSDREGFYLMYAVNSNGEEGFYQYDSRENTYQRITVSVEETPQKEKKAGNSIFDKLQNIVDKYFKIVTVLFGAVFLILLIAFIVTKVKLRNRDIELDDLYDEYGIDSDDAEPAPKNKKNGKNVKNQPAVKQSSRKKVIDEDDFDDYEDEDEFDEYDSYDEDDFEEEVTQTPLRTVKFDDFNTITDIGLDGSDDGDYGIGDYDYDDSDDMIEDLDELLSRRPEEKRSHAEKDDAFKVDFIDLD